MSDELARVDETAAALRSLVGEARYAIVLGSGLSGLADALEAPRARAFDEVPHVPRPTVAGHGGRFVAGRLAGVPVVLMQGRVHAYEGHDAHTVVRPVRALARLGVPRFVLTNASGGIRQDLDAGALLCLDDHLNLTGLDPGVGLADGPLGPRFPDLVGTYDAGLARALAAQAEARGEALARGVYAGRLGPSYETPAEVRMLAALGADVVGMSTVLEAIALRRMGRAVLGVSLVTNAAAGRPGATLDHDDVQRQAAAAGGRLGALLAGLVEAHP